MLKQCLLLLTVAFLFCAVSLTSIAQESGSSNQQATPDASEGMQGHGHGQFDPSKRAAMLAKRLNLSSDQQTKVEEILKSEQSQMQSLRSDSSVSQDDRRSKRMDIHKSSNDQIRGLLNEDQQKKWDEMQTRMMQGHHRGGAAAGGSPDSAPPQPQ